MDKQTKSKKIIIGIVAVLLIIVGVILFIILGKGDKEAKVLDEKNYTMYVKINPLVKLQFKVTHYECLDEKGKKDICEEYSSEVTDFELINDDAKEFYHDLDFKGKTVNESLISLCDVARDNKVAFENLEIVTDHDVDYEKVKEVIKEGSKYHSDLNILVDFRERLFEDDIIDSLEKSEGITSTIDKINLNENILFYHSGGGFGGSCSSDYKIFATNLEELFPGKIDDNKQIYILDQDYIDRSKEEGIWDEKSTYVLDTEFAAKAKEIKYDATKEETIKSEFDALAKEKIVGISGFKYSFNDHMLDGYSFGTISLEDNAKFIWLNKSLNDIYNNMETRINNIIKDAYTIVNLGGCGDFPNPEILTEKDCKEYNLTCERW